jgi:ATP-dependent helicase/nuclease subunit A
LSSFLRACLAEESDLFRWIDTKSLDASPRPRQEAPVAEVLDRRAIKTEYRNLHELVNTTPASRNILAAGQADKAADVEDIPPEERLPEAAENRGARLGTAFHAAMERADLLCRDEEAPGMQELCLRHGLDQEDIRKLREMVGIALSSDLMERVRAAIRSGRRVLRELPFVRSLDSAAIEEGKIDLLFEEEDGWVLVDFKTDWVADNREEAGLFFRNRYAAQINEYRNALKSLSINVVSAYLLLARTGDAVQMS